MTTKIMIPEKDVVAIIKSVCPDCAEFWAAKSIGASDKACMCEISDAWRACMFWPLRKAIQEANKVN